MANPTDVKERLRSILPHLRHMIDQAERNAKENPEEILKVERFENFKNCIEEAIETITLLEDQITCRNVYQKNRYR